MKRVEATAVTHLAQTTVVVATAGRGLVNLTPQAADFVRDSRLNTGLLTAFVRHTSCSLLITENADPDVHRDLEAWMASQVQDGHAMFRHRAEGPDDMSAHIRSVLTATSLSIPVINGGLGLGTWQSLYLWEHRYHGHRREVCFTVMGA